MSTNRRHPVRIVSICVLCIIVKKNKTHLVRERRGGSLLELVFVLSNELGVNLDLGRGEGRGGDKVEGLVADELAGEPEEGLFKVVLWRYEH